MQHQDSLTNPGGCTDQRFSKINFLKESLAIPKSFRDKNLSVIPSLPDAGSAFRVPAFVAAIMSSLSASYCPTVHSFAGVTAADSTTKTRATKRLLICPLAPCGLDKPSSMSQHRGSSKVG